MMNKTWLPNELLYLEENWGIVSQKSIAHNLGRSVYAVKTQAQRLGLGPWMLGGDYISFNQLVKAVTGHSSNSYLSISWIKKRNFPIHKKRVNNNSFQVVYIDEFWKWAEENKSFIDFSKMEPLALGEEPDWVVEQRRKDYYSCSLQKKTPWTPDEDKYLLDLLKMQKFSWTEMSRILHRTEGAIQRHCTDLNIKYRPIKADNHGESSQWKDTHLDVLAKGIKNGDCYAVIGEKIGKSEKAVRGKIYNTYFTENADKVRKMLGCGKWGENAPIPTIKQARHLVGYRTDIKHNLSLLAGVLKVRMNQLGYDAYWQRFMCVNWDDLDGCLANCSECDSCTEFIRIKPQYCARCGSTFYERKENRFCKNCRTAKKRQAQKKWCVLNKKSKQQ